ncbi:uncharacterized protein LOC144141406 [Haemaphysalis longicornis]
MHSTTGLCFLLLAATTFVRPSSSSWLDDPETRPPPADQCPERDVEFARNLLRDALARVRTSLDEVVTVGNVTANGFTLFNGTLSPLRLTSVNITAHRSVCRERQKDFPFVIAVGTEAKLMGVYEYHYAGNNVTTLEDRGRVGVTFSEVSFDGKLSQLLRDDNATGSGSDAASSSTTPEAAWRLRLTMQEFPSFTGIQTGPQNPQRAGVPYFEIMQAADRSFVPVFVKLPETHVLPALKRALGAE